MKSFQESHQPNKNPDPSRPTHQRNLEPFQIKQDFFSFLKKQEKPINSSPSFFSENGLYQDIIKVTGAEPDVCLEVFNALKNTLWPHIEGLSDISFEDAWKKFIGGSSIKGSLCPPEKLITERRARDIKKSLSTQGGERRIFQYLDQVLDSTSHLKQKVLDDPRQILQKEEIIASLDLVQEFYLGFKNKVKALAQAIIEKEQINAPDRLESSDALDDLLEPKAIMMSDIFTHHWAYRISRSQARNLLSLDRYGHKLQSNVSDPSNHRVVALPENSEEPLVFFKANGNPPIQPEKEYMVYSLYQHLQIPIPETALVILTDVFENTPDHFYAIQASEAVLGDSPLQAYRNPATLFEQDAYVSQVIGAFLTNPSDGAFKNFKYSPKYKTFIGIDNDEVFGPELAGKNERKFVKVKSVLYLLPQIELPISQSIKTLFSTFDLHLTIFSWLKDLSQKNQDYQLLFARLSFQKTRCLYQDLPLLSKAPPLDSILQQKVLVDHELHGESFYPQILVSQSLLKSLTEKIQILEKILLTNRSISAQEIFEEISPLLGKYYRKLRFKFDDPEEAQGGLWGLKKNNADDVDYSYLSSLLDSEEFSSFPHNQAELDGNKTPESFYQEYKEVLISKQSTFDLFIRRQTLRINKNILNLQTAFKELKVLVKEELINSESIREICDFSISLSKMMHSDHHLIKEIISILSNLPYEELKWLLTLEKYFLRSGQSLPEDLISSSMAVLGAFMKQRTFILTESEKQYLFDKQGNIRKSPSLTGRSLVTCFPEKNPGFYLKQYPEWPGYEFASTLFMRLLGVRHLPYQDLIIVNSKYPVLLTQKVHGDPVLRIWHKTQVFRNLDPVHTGLLIISAMLINPEDGKEDNFILSPDGKYLIPIDNDHCFLPSTFQKEGSFWNAFTVNTALQMKTILFCLDEMSIPIPLSVKQQIISLDFDSLLKKWMTELEKIENKLNNLVNQNEQNKFLAHGTVMRIPFYKQFIHHMHWKAHKIQDILKTAPQPTPFDLLKAVEPFAAKCYQESLRQGETLQSRFRAATERLYKKTATDGSRVSILNTRAMMEIVHISEKDLQNDIMFQRMGPVDALELLNQLVQERAQKATLEQEMLFELDEKKHETLWIDLFGNSPGEAALKAFFTNPKEGLVLRGSKLITSSKLSELFAQTPDKGMRIRFLSLPESPSLTDKEIRMLAEGCPNIEYLNVSGCIRLKQILTADGEWPLLARLEAKDCVSLEKLVSYSPIKILQIGTYQKIEIFVAKSTVDIFTITQKERYFSFSLKKRKNFEIKFWESSFSSDSFVINSWYWHRWNEIKNNFRDIQITMGDSLISSEYLEPLVSKIKFSGKIENIQDLQKLIVLNLLRLRNLDLTCNEIQDEGLETLIKGNWPLLETLNLSSNKITAEGIEVLAKRSYWPQLRDLDLGNNKINDEGVKVFTQGNWPLLETLSLRSNKITAEGIEVLVKRSHWPQLRDLDLGNNKINDKGLKALTQGNWPLLEILSLYETSVTKKALVSFLLHANWPQFKKIYLPHFWSSLDKDFAYNLIKKDLSEVEQLDLMNCMIRFDQFQTKFKKYQCPRMKHLNISNNDLSLEGIYVLILADCPLLEELHIENIKITLQGIKTIVRTSKWQHLKHLNISNNGVFDEGLAALSSADWLSLESLNLSNTKLSLEGVELIVCEPKYLRLKSLDISKNEIYDEGVSVLALAEWSLMESLNLSNTMLSLNGIEKIVKQSKLSQMLKSLNVSNHEIFDEGLSVLALSEWSVLEVLSIKNTKITQKGIEIIVNLMKLPKLKKLDISENNIFDEGLRILVSRDWPLLQHLVYYNTKVTEEGHIFLLENFKWPHLSHLEHSLAGSFYSYDGNPPEVILAMVPISYKPENQEEQPFLIIVLNTTWFNSKEIFLSISDHDVNENVIILPRNKLDHLKSIKLSLDIFPKLTPLQFVVWPPNLKKLQIASFNKPPSDQIQIENIFSQIFPSIEDLFLFNLAISMKDLEILINRLNPLTFKKLNLSYNSILNEGLEILASAKWPLLELLNLTSTGITFQGLKNFINKSEWPNLKQLDVSFNIIQDEGLKTLTSAQWPLLEGLELKSSWITAEGIKALVNKSNWPNLRKLDLSHNEIGKEGFEVLSYGKWPLLENIILSQMRSTEGIEILMTRSEWPSLKLFDISKNKDLPFENFPTEIWNLLEVLDLTWTNMTMKDVETLVKSSLWPNLKEILLYGNFEERDFGDVRKLLSEKWPKVLYIL